MKLGSIYRHERCSNMIKKKQGQGFKNIDRQHYSMDTIKPLSLLGTGPSCLCALKKVLTFSACSKKNFYFISSPVVQLTLPAIYSNCLPYIWSRVVILLVKIINDKKKCNITK